MSWTPTTPHRRPEALRLDFIGIDPSQVIGKILQSARRSPTHPALTLDFDDKTTVQVLVDGYNPAHRGIPKQLDMDSDLDSLIFTNQSLNLQVLDCAFITLQDAAFDSKHATSSVFWDQKHIGLALKLSEQNPHWHCIWARMEEYDDQQGTCVFRSYDDVYLERLNRTPRKNKWRKSLLQHQGSR